MALIRRLQVSRPAGGFLAAAAAVALLAACHSLEVTNPNNPDLARALTNGDVVQNLLGGAYRQWYHSLVDISTSAPMDVAADHYQSPWGNWGMIYMGSEPRRYALVNSPSDPFFTPMIEGPWYDNYGALASATLVVKALANGVKIPGPTDSSANPMFLAAARFIQGAALSNIALVYDSGYAFDETVDPATKVVLVGRDSVQRAALAKLDVAIALASGATSAWSIPEGFLNQIGEAWTNTQLAQAASYWAARTIAYFPHNVAENSAADWAKVLSYASKGISSGTPFDLEIVGDGGTNGWTNDYMAIGTAFFDWARVNDRVACLLDPAYLCHPPNNTADRPVPQTVDYRFNGDDVVGDNCVPLIVANAIANRVQTGNGYGAHCGTADKLGGADFIYLPTSGQTWRVVCAARGCLSVSNVGFIRYFANGWDSPDYAVGKLPFVLAAENDLLWAEALVRTGGSFATAAAKINKTRVARGHLPALTGGETLAQLLDAIAYEKGIELYGAEPMIPWYDQRRWAPDLRPHYYTAANDSDQTGWLPYGKGLQPGTPHLFPVPARELTLLGDPIYTYGGPNPETNFGPPAPPAGGAAPAHAGGSIFGTTPDGRAILGPGRWAAIADSMIAANGRAHRSRPT